MSSKIDLLFPVETRNRELDFRLFLACLCAREDRRIWVGQRHIVYSLGTCMRGGIYVGKNIFDRASKPKLHRDSKLRERGFRLIHLHEEGAVFRGEVEAWKQELRERFDPTSMAKDDYVCTWGDFQRDFYRSLEPRCGANIRTTGHPRFDLYKSAYRDYFTPEANRLRERYGDFVLINTNLHGVNNPGGLERIFSKPGGSHIQDTHKRLHFFDRWQHLMDTWTHFVHLISRLSVEFPHLNFIIRPHPSESRTSYRTIYAGVANVHTVHEGSVSPWLLACKAMIHNGCTTGLEGHFAGVPVINFRPVVDPRHDAFLPNLFGARCSSDEEVIEHLRGLMKNDTFSQTAGATLPEDVCLLVDNFRRESFPQLVAVIDEAASSMPSGSSSNSSLRYAIQQGLRRYGHKVRTDIRHHFRGNGGERVRKFHEFEEVDLEQRLERVQAITGTRVKFTLHARDLLSVESA